MRERFEKLNNVDRERERERESERIKN